MNPAVTIHEAKTHLSRLVKRVEAGETIVIRRGDTPVAQLVAFEPRPGVTGFGSMRDRIWIAPDFDEPLDDFAEYR
jgi:prevent-host-death family protein